MFTKTKGIFFFCSELVDYKTGSKHYVRITIYPGIAGSPSMLPYLEFEVTVPKYASSSTAVAAADPLAPRLKPVKPPE